VKVEKALDAVILPGPNSFRGPVTVACNPKTFCESGDG